MSVQQIPMTFEQLMQSFQETRREIKERVEQIEKEAKARAEEAEKRAEQAEKEAKARAEESKKRAEEHTKKLAQERKQDRDEWNKRFGEFSDRLGEFIEGMVTGGIVHKFAKYGFSFNESSQRHKFIDAALDIRGEFDILLHDGDYVLGIEVKSKLAMKDVRKHIDRIEKYRQCLDAKGDKRKILGAVAAGVIPAQSQELAEEQGLFVITQSGEAFEVLAPSKGFKPKEW
ncbi:hypothetical protein FACS189419_08390 [Planctomycetales bacterium]|nr:hypothetical protein FACS189419_08390 [Planctomycetales bacterium]